jgi:hypothetical protein
MPETIVVFGKVATVKALQQTPDESNSNSALTIALPYLPTWPSNSSMCTL